MLYLKLYEDWRSSGSYHEPENKELPKYEERDTPEHKAKFLIDYDYTYDWVLKYHPNMEIDYMTDDEEDYKTTAKITIEQHIKSYMKLFKKPIINIQRKITVKNISDIKYNNLGVFWSFQKISVTFPHGIMSPYYTVIFHGSTTHQNINWENSLDNFVYYGHDESEVKLFPDSKIVITDVEIIHQIDWKTFENLPKEFLEKTLPFTINT